MWQAVVVVVIEGEDKTSNDQGDYHTDAMNISLEISSYAQMNILTIFYSFLLIRTGKGSVYFLVNVAMYPELLA